MRVLILLIVLMMIGCESESTVYKVTDEFRDTYYLTHRQPIPHGYGYSFYDMITERQVIVDGKITIERLK